MSLAHYVFVLCDPRFRLKSKSKIFESGRVMRCQMQSFPTKQPTCLLLPSSKVKKGFFDGGDHDDSSLEMACEAVSPACCSNSVCAVHFAETPPKPPASSWSRVRLVRFRCSCFAAKQKIPNSFLGDAEPADAAATERSENLSRNTD
jgi:hypothetical protein